MSVTSYACGICGSGFGCDGAAFAAHMHAAHQLEMLTPRVMMSREEYESLAAERDALAERVRDLEAALLSLVDNAGGYDKSIVRALALQARSWTNEPLATALVDRVLEAEERARAALAASRQPEAGAAVEADHTFYLWDDTDEVTRQFCGADCGLPPERHPSHQPATATTEDASDAE